MKDNGVIRGLPIDGLVTNEKQNRSKLDVSCLLKTDTCWSDYRALTKLAHWPTLTAINFYQKVRTERKICIQTSKVNYGKIKVVSLGISIVTSFPFSI